MKQPSIEFSRPRNSLSYQIRRVVGSIFVVVLGLIPVILVFAIVADPAERSYWIRILLFFVFTMLPISFYPLFIVTRVNALWEEYHGNLARLDPVGYKDLESIFYKKFKMFYGSPDKSGFGSALLPKEALFPVLYATFLLGLGWALYFFAAFIGTKDPHPFIGYVHPFTFGFLGAYMFSLQMLFRRYVQSDLKAVAYTHVSKRILLTWIWAILLTVLPLSDLGIVVTQENTFKSVLAFSIGIFPDIAWQVLSQFIQRIFSIAVPSLREKNPLREIDGMTIWVEARLLEEDIENIENLITAGIVDLMLRTNIKPERLVHWIDQAVLRVRLGHGKKNSLQQKLEQSLRDHGIITATDLIFTYKSVVRKIKQGDSTKFFLSEELDPLVRDLVTAMEDDPNMYHVLAWREMNVNRIVQLKEVVKTQIDHNQAKSTGSASGLASAE